MGARSSSSHFSIHILVIIGAAACSVVNAGEEPTDGDSSSSTTTTSTSSGGGAGGAGGEDGCGDGDIQDPEECDDEGESATCDDDCTAVECLDGTTNSSAGEECDDGAESADCDDDCTTRVCGDGTTNATANEECDDSNTTSNDGCSSECVAEGKCSAPAALDLVADGNGWVADMNWATSGAGLVPSATCDGQDDIGQGPDRVFALTLTAVSNVHIELTGSGWDPVLRLMEAACNPATEIPEDGANVDGCSDLGDIGAIEHLTYTALPADDYFILVDGAAPTDAGAFHLHVEIQ